MPSLVSTLRRILLVPAVLAVGYAVATEWSTVSATLRRLSWRVMSPAQAGSFAVVPRLLLTIADLLTAGGGAALWAARASKVGSPSMAVD